MIFFLFEIRFKVKMMKLFTIYPKILMYLRKSPKLDERTIFNDRYFKYKNDKYTTERDIFSAVVNVRILFVWQTKILSTREYFHNNDDNFKQNYQA